MRFIAFLAFSLLIASMHVGDASAEDSCGANPGRDPAAVATSPHSTLSHTPLAGDGYYLLDIDTLFYVENRGLTRIHITLNGHKFKLVTDVDEVMSSKNAFRIPEHGEITLSIAEYMQPDIDNYMEVDTQGPSGSDANVVISNTLVPGQQVAYRIEDLETFPALLTLGQAYPNPFQDAVTITYSIAESRTSGVNVLVEIYDVAGRLMRTLVDSQRFPGTFEVQWDGADSMQRDVPSGVYICRLIAGESQHAVTLVRIGSGRLP